MSLQDPNVVNRSRKKRVAIVIANPSTSTTTGWPVGFWWSELTHSYFVLSEKGYEVDVFSPNGGACQADALSDPRDPSGYSSSDLVTMGFIATPQCVALVGDTRPAARIDVDAYDAILVAGGQAPMFTFDTAETLQTKFVEFYERGKLAVALCHGVARAAEFFRHGHRRAPRRGTWTIKALFHQNRAFGPSLSLNPRRGHP
jgi:putative intracellular protease/amidase